MNPVLSLLVLAAILVILGLAALAIVIVSIHTSERHMNLTRAPQTRLQAVVRRMLGVHSDQKKSDIPYAGARR